MLENMDQKNSEYGHFSCSARSMIPDYLHVPARDGSRAAATSKVERSVIFNVFQTLTIITKRSILDVSAAQDPPLLARYVKYT